MRTVRKTFGTIRYTSINSHERIEYSRRDDLEAIGYVLVYFARGRLPWQNIHIQDKAQKYAQICHLKKTTPLDELCQGAPSSLIRYLEYCRALEFEATPDYDYLRSLFLKSASEADFQIEDCSQAVWVRYFMFSTFMMNMTWPFFFFSCLHIPTRVFFSSTCLVLCGLLLFFSASPSRQLNHQGKMAEMQAALEQTRQELAQARADLEKRNNEIKMYISKNIKLHAEVNRLSQLSSLGDKSPNVDQSQQASGSSTVQIVSTVHVVPSSVLGKRKGVFDTEQVRVK
jgi:hypothetical protein